MMDLTLGRNVHAEWHSIADIADRVGQFLLARRASKLTAGDVISHLSALIDFIDQTSASIHATSQAVEELIAKVAALPPDEAEQFQEALAELRRSQADKERVIRSHRLQVMDYMIQVNPEDAWVYEPENLATLHRAMADADAGRVTRYHSDEDFLAALERAPVNADA